MPVGAAIGAATVGGSLISAFASNKAAAAQTAAADKATAVQQHMYDTTRGDLAPYRGVGNSAAGTLASFYGLDPNGGGQTGQAYNPASLTAFENSPDYQFSLDQGIKGLDRSAAAKGLLQSGGQKQALVKYASGLASTNLGSYLDRLYQMSSMGENASAQTGSAGANAANGIANTTLASGEAQASGIVGGANAINSGIGSAVNNGLSYYRMTNPSSSYGSTGNGANSAVLNFNRSAVPGASSSFLY